MPPPLLKHLFSEVVTLKAYIESFTKWSRSEGKIFPALIDASDDYDFISFLDDVFITPTSSYSDTNPIFEFTTESTQKTVICLFMFLMIFEEKC